MVVSPQSMWGRVNVGVLASRTVAVIKGRKGQDGEVGLD